MSLGASLLLGLVVAVAAGCTRPTPGYCERDAGDCPAGQRCDTTLYMCVASGGASGGGGAGGAGGGGAGSGGHAGDTDGGDARAGADGGQDGPVVPQCDNDNFCRTTDAGNACAVDAGGGVCVECTENRHCGTAAPFCRDNVCTPCRKDTECAEPGVCLENGTCATTDQVVFAEYRSGICPTSGSGSKADPYCTPALAAAHIMGTRNVLVIRGAMPDPLIVPPATTLVVGQPALVGQPPTMVGGGVRALAGTGITVNSGNVVIRNLKVVGGEATTARGISISGTSVVTLRDVQVDLGMGIGVHADTGSELFMDRCQIVNNSGGLLINGARYDIANSVFTTNGYGVQFSAAVPPSPSRFWFNTVVNNTSYAAHCDAASPRPLYNSILGGRIENCEPDPIQVDVPVPTFDPESPLSPQERARVHADGDAEPRRAAAGHGRRATHAALRLRRGRLPVNRAPAATRQSGRPRAAGGSRRRRDLRRSARARCAASRPPTAR